MDVGLEVGSATTARTAMSLRLPGTSVGNDGFSGTARWSLSFLSARVDQETRIFSSVNFCLPDYPVIKLNHLIL